MAGKWINLKKFLEKTVENDQVGAIFVKFEKIAEKVSKIEKIVKKNNGIDKMG